MNFDGKELVDDILSDHEIKILRGLHELRLSDSTTPVADVEAHASSSQAGDGGNPIATETVGVSENADKTESDSDSVNIGVAAEDTESGSAKTEEEDNVVVEAEKKKNVAEPSSYIKIKKIPLPQLEQISKVLEGIGNLKEPDSLQATDINPSNEYEHVLKLCGSGRFIHIRFIYRKNFQALWGNANELQSFPVQIIDGKKTYMRYIERRHLQYIFYGGPVPVEKVTKPKSELDESGLDPDNIALVMECTNVPRSQAIMTLVAYADDPFKAIQDLSQCH